MNNSKDPHIVVITSYAEALADCISDLASPQQTKEGQSLTILFLSSIPDSSCRSRAACGCVLVCVGPAP